MREESTGGPIGDCFLSDLSHTGLAAVPAYLFLVTRFSGDSRTLKGQEPSGEVQLRQTLLSEKTCTGLWGEAAGELQLAA